MKLLVLQHTLFYFILKIKSYLLKTTKHENPVNESLDTYSLPDGIGLKGRERDRQREKKRNEKFNVNLVIIYFIPEI